MATLEELNYEQHTNKVMFKCLYEYHEFLRKNNYSSVYYRGIVFSDARTKKYRHMWRFNGNICYVCPKCGVSKFSRAAKYGCFMSSKTFKKNIEHDWAQVNIKDGASPLVYCKKCGIVPNCAKKLVYAVGETRTEVNIPCTLTDAEFVVKDIIE